MLSSGHHWQARRDASLSTTVARSGCHAWPASGRLIAERDTQARRRSVSVGAELLQAVVFHVAVVHVATVSDAEASVVATAKATSALVPAGTHSATETIRHEAVDDRVGAALHVRQQVSRQLSTKIRWSLRNSQWTIKVIVHSIKQPTNGLSSSQSRYK